MAVSDFQGFKGHAFRIDDFDIPRIGHQIGVGEDELHAFMDVEAAGSGFDSVGRPKMLFEPHLFYRYLSGEKRDRAVREGLAYPRWGQQPYPRDSYPRLIRAMAIDESAALRAASWGLGQVLGSNHLMLGYQQPQQMVRSFMEDEAAHLEGMVAFLVANDLDDDMRRLREIALSGRRTTASDAAPIVRVYNGPGYAKNNYHVKFANSHNRWRAIADTPWNPGGPEIIVPSQPEPDTVFPVLREGDGIRKNLNLQPYVRRAQEALKAKGYDPNGIDGKFGLGTRSAVEAFQRANDLSPDGVIGINETWPALLA